MKRLLVVALLMLAACSSGADTDTAEVPTATASTGEASAAESPASELDAASPTEAPGRSELSGELVVFAAASLTEAFERIGSEFGVANPDVNVTHSFGPSNGLATQIVEGAPADVFAAANMRQMTVVTDAGLAEGAPVVFVQNALEIAVEQGNPLMVMGLEDLANPEVKVVLAAAEVPAGEFAQQVLDEAGVMVTPVSLEPDVRATLTRVELGEADAAIVYRSDVVTSAGIEGVAIPEDQNVVAEYPVAALAEAPNPAAAAAFVEFLAGDEAAAAFEEAGFTVP